MTTFALRQQLTSDALSLIQRCVASERERLKKLHWDIVELGAGSATLDTLQRNSTLLENAEKELLAVFLDQFEEGRQENTSKGRIGVGSQGR